MTETTQPDPQVVAWMRGHMRRHPGACIHKVVDAYVGEPADLSAFPVLHASARAARTPLTVADIPAGQGPASLYVDEYGVVRYRAANGRGVVIPTSWDPADDDGWAALNAALEHLAATLPHVP
jgi:hypothetical protein